MSVITKTIAIIGLIFFIFMIIIPYYQSSSHIGPRSFVGVPFGFYPAGEYGSIADNPEPVEFSWLFFILDIIFWLIISFVVWIMIIYLSD